MNKIISLFLLLGVFSVFSCSEGDEIKPVSFYGDYFSISYSNAHIDGEGGTWTTPYYADRTPIVISSVPSWLIVNITDDEIILNASRNDSGSERKAEITFLTNYRTEKISVYQEKFNQATVEANEMYVFSDGMCTDWKFGTGAYSFYYYCISENDMKNYYSTDQSLLNYLKGQEKRSVSGYEDYIYRYSHMYPSTTYYLCAVALDKYGNAGPIYKKRFTTRSTYEPVASITSFYLNYSNSWKYNVSLKNNAKKYYAWINWTQSKTTNEHFLAYFAYRQIKSGSLSSTTSLSNSYTSTSDYLHLITVAADSYGDLGNYDYKLATRSSYSKAVLPSLGSKDEESPYGCISIEELEKNMIRIE